MTAEERKEKRPDVDRADVVFADDGGVSYEIKYPVFSEEEIKKNSEALRKMESIISLNGKELSYNGTSLKARLEKYFNLFGNNVYSPLFGDVGLTTASIHDDLGHGMTKQKAAAFYAIPNIILKEVVVNSEKRRGGRYDRIVVAAKIEIDKVPYVAGVMLQRDNQSQRLYAHDVWAISEEEMTSSQADTPSKTESEKNENHLFITTILRNAFLSIPK